MTTPLPTEDAECEACGETYRRKVPHQRFCSDKCRSAWHNAIMVERLKWAKSVEMDDG